MKFGALLLAAGSGSRMNGEVADKLLHPIGNTNAFSLCLAAFIQSAEIKELMITYRNEEQLASFQQCVKNILAQCNPSPRPKIEWVLGGKERQDSVLSGLLALEDSITHVLVHDCARPLIRQTTISELCREVARDRAVSVARPLKDSLRLRLDQTNEPLNPATTKTIDRSNHWLMETPQGAPRDWLINGLRKSIESHTPVTDDMGAIELLGYPVGFLEPDYPNPKITTPDDLLYIHFLQTS